MKLSKDTWHYKLWRKSFSYGEYVPEETDLCRYCHKVFWQLVAYAALVSMIVVAVGLCIALLVMIGKVFWMHTALALKITVGAVLGITAIVLYVRWLNRGRSYSEPQTLVGKYVSATKQKVCPLVEFEGGQPRSYFEDEDEDS